MNPMQHKTPEERKEIAARSHATRRARRAAEQSARQEALKYAGGLREKIAALELRLKTLERFEQMNAASAAVSGKSLLLAEEISNAALPWVKASGVYFLLDGEEVVYVGQATNVYSRIGQHKDKKFDRYAFVPCHVDMLDKLESLYIHFLRPKLNGNNRNDAKCAPISLDELLSITNSMEITNTCI